MELPSTDMVNNRRIEKFKQRISETLEEGGLDLFKGLIEQYRQESQVDTLDIAAALAKLMQGRAPFLLSAKSEGKPAREFRESESRPRRERPLRDEGPGQSRPRREAGETRVTPLEEGMDRFRIEVGHLHKVMPGNIVGAIANEANIDSKYIGRITIFDDYSTVDLPEDMPGELLKSLQNTRVSGQRMNISLLKKEKRGGDEPMTRAKPLGVKRDKPEAGPRRDKPESGGKRDKPMTGAKRDKPDAGGKRDKPDAAKAAAPRPKKRHKDMKDKGKPKRVRDKEAKNK